MSGSRLSLKSAESLPPPTVEQALSRLAGDIPPVPRSQLKKGVEPHDLRWFVGGLGRALISLGLLIFAFAGYQLWGTGLQYRQHQNDLEAEFAELKATISVAPPPNATVVPTSVQSEPDASIAPGPDPTSPTPVTDPLAPAIAPISDFDIELGQGIAYVKIPALNLEAVLVAGVRTEDLKKGVGHFPDTPMPGQAGNAAIAGHRTTHGAPFGDLDRLVTGDRITIETLQGTYVYVVQGSKIVPPSDYSVVANVPDQNLLTLVTCNPKYSAKERLIVTAVLDETTSDPVAEPEINYGKDASEPVAGSDGLAGEEPNPDGQADAGVENTSAAVPPVVSEVGLEPVDEPPASEPTTNGSIAGPASQDQTGESAGGAVDTGDESEGGDGEAAASANAFAAGWFSDPDAWPQVALWGLACTGVSLLAWVLGRRTRNWFSALVGFGPFVIVLYFFFENVNRLLPPNL